MSGDAKGRAGPVGTFPPPGPDELLGGFLEVCFTAALDIALPLQELLPEIVLRLLLRRRRLLLLVSFSAWQEKYGALPPPSDMECGSG